MNNKSLTIQITHRHRMISRLIVIPLSMFINLDIIDEILESANDEFREGDLVTPKLIKSSNDKLSAHLNLRLRLKNGDVETRLCNVKLFEYFEWTALKELAINSDSSSEYLYVKLGQLAGRLYEFFRTKNYLRDQLRTIRLESQWTWQLITCKPGVQRLTNRLYPDETNERRIMINQVIKRFDSIKDKLCKYPEIVLHGDINGKNVLVNCCANESSKIQLCIIDFQDIQVGQRVVELAIMLLYSVLEQEKIEFEDALKLIPRWVLLGYQEFSPTNCILDDDELVLIPHLMALRLCQSVLNGQVAFEMDPENHYVMETNQRGWKLLELLTKDPIFCDYDNLIKFWRG